ncbi:MAG: ABC transporter permease, partial [Phycisphaerae bacterium]
MTSLTTSLILPSASLWRREIVTFLRQRSRVGGTLGTPLVFWILLGCGLASSFRLSVSGADVTGGTDMDSITYLEYSFPGALVLMVLFTAVFATISVIEDRHGGFLQAVLVAPVSRSAIVMGKVMGSSTLVLLQATLFLMIAPLAGIR